MEKILKVTNRDELTYVMAYYGIDNIPISMAMAKDGYVFSTGKYALPVGKVIRKGDGVAFVQDICARGVPVEPAIRHAFSVVNDVIDLMSKMKEATVQKLRFHKGGRDPKDEVSEVKGTFDEIFEKRSLATNHLRYLSGWYYEFVDPKVESMYGLWSSYIPKDRSFNLYYPGSTIVD